MSFHSIHRAIKIHYLNSAQILYYQNGKRKMKKSLQYKTDAEGILVSSGGKKTKSLSLLSQNLKQNLEFLFTRKMLTKKDLRWTTKFFSLYSKSCLIPVTFTPVMLGGGGDQMKSEKISIWRRIGFKMTQLLFTCQTLFISFCTLEYVRMVAIWSKQTEFKKLEIGFHC